MSAKPCWPNVESAEQLAERLEHLDKRITSPGENAILGAAAAKLREQARRLSEAQRERDQAASDYRAENRTHTETIKEFVEQRAYAERSAKALRKIASNGPKPKKGWSAHGCATCLHWWDDNTTEHHAPDCAYVVARDALAEAPQMSVAHDHTFCPHCKPCRHAPKLDELDALRGAMVGLASRYGNGPGGGEFTTLEDMTERITEGVDTIVKVEKGRSEVTSAAPYTTDDEFMAWWCSAARYQPDGYDATTRIARQAFEAGQRAPERHAQGDL